jgi:hypothetical protein
MSNYLLLEYFLGRNISQGSWRNLFILLRILSSLENFFQQHYAFLNFCLIYWYNLFVLFFPHYAFGDKFEPILRKRVHFIASKCKNNACYRNWRGFISAKIIVYKQWLREFKFYLLKQHKQSSDIHSWWVQNHSFD